MARAKFGPSHRSSLVMALGRQLNGEIPRRTLSETLLLATWNIREFDSAAYGERLDESFLYIAEIVSRFDIVAIQEVREDLKALDRLTALLGPWWRYIATDVTEGKPGNRERMAMLFDSRKVRFSGVAGEVVIPPVSVRVAGEAGRRKTVYEPARQLYRTPFLCGFKAGWFRFMLCTVHIAYGAGKKNDENRQVEIEGVARFLAKRADEAQAWSENMILAKGYCVSTVGLDEAVVREYIRNQEVSDRQQEEFDV